MTSDARRPELPTEARISAQRAGKFIPTRLLGCGGMGEVWKAWQTDLGRWVAMKFLRTEGAEDIERFVREAQTAGALKHPNIVGIHEIGEHDGRHFIAMDFIDGESLAQLRLQPREAAERISEAAQAVDFAHAKGIVHRDLKPANLMLDAGEARRIYVMDFGLARQVKAGTTMTMSGTVVGTPAYMPPEQARGEKADARSDVYALGATLHELLAGRPPFEGDNVFAILEKVVAEDPPTLPGELGVIVAKAMEKDPARRYQSARAFAADLRRHLAGEPIVAKPAGVATKLAKWMRRHPAIAATGAVAVLSAVALAAVVIGTASARAAEKRREVADFLRKGRDAGAAVERLRRELAPLRERLEQLKGTLPKHEPKPGEYWEVQRRIEKCEREAAAEYGEMLVQYTAALGVAPDNADARTALARIHFSEFERAERDRDVPEMGRSEKLTLLFDRKEYEAKLARSGTLEVSSRPEGAEAELFRFDEGADRRLVLRSVTRLGAGAHPIESGSYLVVLRKPGFRDVRYPVRIARGTNHRAAVNLYTEEQIGGDLVYIPAGPFLRGGDPEAYLAGPLAEEQVEDFFISRTEITMREYFEFLNDRAHHTFEQAWAHVPRESSRSGHFVQRRDPLTHPSNYARLPVFGISWSDASAYCAWTSRRVGRAVRLPTEREGEKAARGADGRFFPWGNEFDWSFTKGANSREQLPPRGEPVGTFEADESPYGVRDLGGGIREWCDAWATDAQNSRSCRGGAFCIDDDRHYRSATRAWLDGDVVYPALGFRVAVSAIR